MEVRNSQNIFKIKPELGTPIKADRDMLKNNTPHVVVGTPGRIKGLAKEGTLKLDKVKHFVLDECDKMLEALGIYYRFEKSSSHNLCRHASGCARNFPQDTPR
jgi:hypothetical protein